MLKIIIKKIWPWLFVVIFGTMVGMSTRGFFTRVSIDGERANYNQVRDEARALEIQLEEITEKLKNKLIQIEQVATIAEAEEVKTLLANYDLDELSASIAELEDEKSQLIRDLG